MIAFSFLHFTYYCKQEMINSEVSERPPIDGSMVEEENGVPHTDSSSIIIKQKEVNLDVVGINKESKDLTTVQFGVLLLGITVLNGLSNGVLSSTASYSALPYGNQAYNLLNRLCLIANPLACFVALFFRCTSLCTVGGLTSIAVLLAGYQLDLAGASPNPPLQGDIWGEFLVVRTIAFHIH